MPTAIDNSIIESASADLEILNNLVEFICADALETMTKIHPADRDLVLLLKEIFLAFENEYLYLAEEILMSPTLRQHFNLKYFLYQNGRYVEKIRKNISLIEAVHTLPDNVYCSDEDYPEQFRSDPKKFCQETIDFLLKVSKLIGYAIFNFGRRVRFGGMEATRCYLESIANAFAKNVESVLNSYDTISELYHESEIAETNSAMKIQLEKIHLQLQLALYYNITLKNNLQLIEDGDSPEGTVWISEAESEEESDSN